MEYVINCQEKGQNETASLAEVLCCKTDIKFKDIRTKEDIEYAKKILDNLELQD